MERIPFGIHRLDVTLDGGAPPGSVVLLAGEAGAGAREFMHTAAVMHGVATADEELFDLHYGRLPESAVLPERVQYLSFTADSDHLHAEIERSMDADLARTGLDHVEFVSLADRYFEGTAVPSGWYDHVDRDDLETPAPSLLDVVGELVGQRAPGNLLIVDSLSDVIDAAGEGYSTQDVVVFLKGLRVAASEWGGLVLVHVEDEALAAQLRGQLVQSTTGAFTFQWASGGSVLARTLVLNSFRGILSQIGEDDLVEFETNLGDSGFTVSDTRKIR